MKVRLNQWILAACCLTLLSNPAVAGKPGGGGNPPPPPSISTRFRVDLITSQQGPVAVRGFNNLGTIVGHLESDPIRAYMFHAPTQTYYDFNSDAALQPLRDQLEVLLGSGWLFGSARGINDLGQVVGRVDNWLTGEQRGFALDTFNLSPPVNWELRLLPEFPGLRSRGDSIASNGRVLGQTYDYTSRTVALFICNPWESNATQMIPLSILFQGNVRMNSYGDLAGISSDLTLFVDVNPTDGLPNRQQVPNVADCVNLGGINDLRELAAYGRLKTGPKRSDWTSRSALRISSQSEVVGSGYTYDINGNGDIAFNENYLAYNGSPADSKQSVKVLDLIDNNDPFKPLFAANTFRVTEINDRDNSRFGQMAGEIQTVETGKVGFVLTPIAE